MLLERIAASMVQTWRNSEAGIEPLSAGVARRLRLLPVMLKDFAVRAAVSVIPDSLLALGTYRPYAVLPYDWDNEYGSGQWSYMRGVGDLARYSLIVGYYDFYKAGGSILDVGCGEGILQQKLAALGYRHYVGVDISANAILRAATRTNACTEFRHADIESFVPHQKFDLIIFNEVLSYCSDPVSIVRRLADSLAPAGIMIASNWMAGVGRRKSLQIWRLIDSIAEIIDSTTAFNREVWAIKVFRPKPAFTGNQRWSNVGASHDESIH